MGRSTGLPCPPCPAQMQGPGCLHPHTLRPDGRIPHVRGHGVKPSCVADHPEQNSQFSPRPMEQRFYERGSAGCRGAPAHRGHGPAPLPAAGLWQGPALCLPEGAALSPQVSSPTGRPASQTRRPRGHRCRHAQALTQQAWTQPPAQRAGGGLCPLGTPSGLPPPIRVPATGKTQQDGALT